LVIKSCPIHSSSTPIMTVTGLICSICTVNSYITRIEGQDMAKVIIIKVTKEIKLQPLMQA